MKREGHRHQTFRIMPLPPLNTGRRRLMNQFESPSAAGIATKVPTKPTNDHSKPITSGRPCSRGNGYDWPAAAVCKSKKVHKAKGTHKVVGNNSFGDSVSDLRLASCWRVVYSNPGLHYSGFSASQYLDLLDNDQFHSRSTYVYDQDYCLDDEFQEIDESGG